MKKNVLSILFCAIAIVGVASIFTSCDKVSKKNNSEQSVQYVTKIMPYEIPSFKRTGDIDSMTYFNHVINIDSFLKSFDSNFDTSSIQSVTLRSAFFSCDTNLTKDNFGNFHTLSLGIKTMQHSYLTRFASFMNISDSDRYTITINQIDNRNLKDYFKSDSLSFRIYGNVRDTNGYAIKGNAELVFDMKLAN
jgi:PBP1b-binding outer membrane lipoprotein LpoB